MRLRDIKIGSRLGLGFGCIVLLTAIISIIAIENMMTLSDLTVKLYRHPFTVSTASLRIESNIAKMHRSMKDVALATDETGTDAAAETVAAYEKKVYEDFEIIINHFLGDMEQIESVREMFSGWKPIRDEVIRLMQAGEKKQAADITKGKGASYVKLLNEKILGVIVFAKDKPTHHQRNLPKWLRP